MNTARFNAGELANAADGVWWLESAPQGELEIYTDSRQDGAGKIFLALRGERFNAHDFLPMALERGAAALLIAADRTGKIPAECPIPVLVVPDTLRAYQSLARFHRERFAALRVVAVTGSVGKTSVKEMLRAIFVAASGRPEAVLATEGNTNNQIGVAQNLLRLNADHRYAVIEMGTNHHGEIAPLSRMAKPLAALVNTIAPCHLEFLGDLNGVAREKSQIYRGVPPQGYAFYPAACAGRQILQEAALRHQSDSFGPWNSGAMVEAEYRQGTLTGSRVALYFRELDQSLEFDWKLTGAHQAVNAAGAALAAWRLGVPPEEIVKGLAQCELPGMRMRITEHERVTWVNDAYNANPESMAALLRHLQTMTFPGKLLLVLGDMLELGTVESALHLEILNLAEKLLPNATIFTVGERFRACRSERAYPDAQSAGCALAAHLSPGATVVLKGSRGMALEFCMPEVLRNAQH